MALSPMNRDQELVKPRKIVCLQLPFLLGTCLRQNRSGLYSMLQDMKYHSTENFLGRIATDIALFSVLLHGVEHVGTDDLDPSVFVFRPAERKICMDYFIINPFRFPQTLQSFAPDGA